MKTIDESKRNKYIILAMQWSREKITGDSNAKLTEEKLRAMEKEFSMSPKEVLETCII